MRSRRATARDGLDDDQAATAARAGMCQGLRPTVAGAVGLALWRRDREQLTCAREVVGTPTLGEEPVVADAMEAVGQHVEQKAADELVDGECHPLHAVV